MAFDVQNITKELNKHLSVINLTTESLKF